MFTEPLPSNDRGGTHAGIQTHGKRRLTAEELLEAVLSLLSDHKLHKEDNSLLRTAVI
jgi:hypothetical protein